VGVGGGKFWGDEFSFFRLLKLAMWELDVAISEPAPRPFGIYIAFELEVGGAVTPNIDVGSGFVYVPGALCAPRGCLAGGTSYEDAEDSVRAYPLRCSIDGALRRNTFLGLPDLLCTVVCPLEIPSPVGREESDLFVAPDSLLAVPRLAELKSLPTGTADVAVLDDEALVLLLLCMAREKNDVGGAGSFDVFEVVDVIEALLETPVSALSLSSLSGFFAARKPNALREAMVAGGSATRSDQALVLRTWAM